MRKTIASLSLCASLLWGCTGREVEDITRVNPRSVEYTIVTEIITGEEQTPTGTIYEITEERKRMLELQVPAITGSLPGYFFVNLELTNQQPELTARKVICIDGYGKLPQRYYIDFNNQ